MHNVQTTRMSVAHTALASMMPLITAFSRGRRKQANALDRSTAINMFDAPLNIRYQRIVSGLKGFGRGVSWEAPR